MPTNPHLTMKPTLLPFLSILTVAAFATARDVPTQLPAVDNTPPATDKPVKVYIMAGQSNMVGIGQVTGGGSRWGSEFVDVSVAVYPGKPDPEADYAAMEPTQRVAIKNFGGVKPDPYPGGGTQVARGFIGGNRIGSCFGHRVVPACALGGNGERGSGSCA